MANLNTYVGAYMKFPTDINPFLFELYLKEKDNENSPIAGLISYINKAFYLFPDEELDYLEEQPFQRGFFLKNSGGLETFYKQNIYLPQLDHYKLQFSQEFHYDSGEQFAKVDSELILQSIEEVKLVYGYLIEYIDKRIVETVRQKWRERVNAAPDDIPLTYIPTTTVEFGCFNYYDNL